MRKHIKTYSGNGRNGCDKGCWLNDGKPILYVCDLYINIHISTIYVVIGVWVEMIFISHQSAHIPLTVYLFKKCVHFDEYAIYLCVRAYTYI